MNPLNLQQLSMLSFMRMPLQGHRADGPTRGTFDSMRLAVLEAHRFDINSPGKSTFGREGR